MEAFRDNKLTLGNRIKPATYEASYGRYLKWLCCTSKAANQPDGQGAD